MTELIFKQVSTVGKGVAFLINGPEGERISGLEVLWSNQTHLLWHECTDSLQL